MATLNLNLTEFRRTTLLIPMSDLAGTGVCWVDSFQASMRGKSSVLVDVFAFDAVDKAGIKCKIQKILNEQKSNPLALVSFLKDVQNCILEDGEELTIPSEVLMELGNSLGRRFKTDEVVYLDNVTNYKIRAFRKKTV